MKQLEGEGNSLLRFRSRLFTFAQPELGDDSAFKLDLKVRSPIYKLFFLKFSLIETLSLVTDSLPPSKNSLIEILGKLHVENLREEKRIRNAEKKQHSAPLRLPLF
ncbi:hypothetical protein Mal48_37260 [Thalassoglobus polymorphus]|uniref:Uncharacterized protein n=1 Tax=Thalassoglobus polymorphus TaxID=2527994 RepID=A0A517QS62_9PLAN|nr:hypothetical protein Mal48_37260 [Thalassoglobus polymorphus]